MDLKKLSAVFCKVSGIMYKLTPAEAGLIYLKLYDNVSLYKLSEAFENIVKRITKQDSAFYEQIDSDKGVLHTTSGEEWKFTFKPSGGIEGYVHLKIIAEVVKSAASKQ